MYKPEYCDLIIEQAEKGKDLNEFAELVKADVSTVYRWGRKHPEFKIAMETAEQKLNNYWEQMYKDSKQIKFDYSKFLFMMECVFGDKHPKKT